MSARTLSLLVACTAGLLLVAMPASANIITYHTPADANITGNPVDANVTFTTSAGNLHIVLTNLQADPRAVNQCLSGLLFTISTGQTSGTLTSSSGIERTVASNGSYTVGGSVATGWAVSTVGSAIQLTMLGTPTAPDHTIIGPANGSNIYGTANSSITNGVHSPFLGLTATFDIGITGLTSASTVSAATFYFNTDPGYTSHGEVPEPASMTLLLGGSVIMIARIRRRRVSIALK